MHIVFYGKHEYWGGLANNGGTRTILKSCEVLRDLGHTVDVVATVDKHTWLPHDPPLKKIPKTADAVVAISVHDIKLIRKESPKSARLFYWMRELPLWKMEKEKIISRCRKVCTICNATHLQKWLQRHGVKSSLCYSGLDLDLWEDHEERNNARTVVGVLYGDKPIKGWKDSSKICRLLPEREYTVRILNNAPFKNLHDSDLVRFYNKINIWVAACYQEGFHNVPAEAALCGCYVVGIRAAHSGTSDYLDETTGALWSSPYDAVDEIKNPRYDNVKRMQCRLYNQIGSREKNMQKFVDLLKEK